MPKNVLSEEDEANILMLLKAGVSQTTIARLFQVDQSTISKLLKRVVEENAPEDPLAARYKRRQLP